MTALTDAEMRAIAEEAVLDGSPDVRLSPATVLALLDAKAKAEARAVELETVLRAAEKHIFDLAEERSYDPPAPMELVADMAAALATPDVGEV